MPAALLAAVIATLTPWRAPAAGADATYVGAARCAPCHQRETELWRGSHHDHAMELPTGRTVRGNFANATFTKDGVTTTFFKRGDDFFVRTDGPDGKLHEYRVRYTFGFEPLQQYVLELAPGRFQVLSIAWDTRPAAAGGQRWFHLYPNEKIDHTDVLHWTGPAQNWNHMCAECHVTDFRKRWDAKTGTFGSTWAEPNVACEACHGPGSAHVAWAEQAKRGAAPPDPTRGLVVALRDGSGGVWALATGASIAQRTAPPSSAVQLETCGRCHSRRAQIWADGRPGDGLAQTHRVALLDAGLYQADGQIEDEVYEYGSFLQSRMHAAGVRCSDCHDPHSLRLRADGNAVCAQCHAPNVFDTKRHHFHAEGTKAAECVSCHMPERLYMVVDGRRDHGFRVPRPDLSFTLGTPNACNDCHVKEAPAWANAALDRWYGAGRKRRPSFAAALHAGRTSAPGADEKLARAARDPELPAIARATALELVAAHPSPRSLPAVRASLADPDPLVRRAAASALAAVEPAERAALAGPLLRDPVRTVRLEALGPFLEVPAGSATPEQRADVARVVEEYRAVQALNADRADAQVNAGNLAARIGDDAAARAAFETAIRLQPSFAPAYVNLADLQRRIGAEPEAEATLRRGIAAAPGVAELHHALGLSLVRQGKAPAAVPELAKASALAPGEPRYAYVLAVALHDGGEPARAVAVLEEAQRRAPGSPELLSALVDYEMRAGHREAALAWARKLHEATGDPQVAAFIARAEAPRPGAPPP